MRARSLILALVCVLAPLSARAQTAVTGNLKDVGVANASGSNTYVRFTLIDYGAQIPRIINLAGNVVFNPIKDFKPDVNGNISGVIQGNDTISPPATKYQVCIFYQGAVFRCNTYIINGATFNLNTAVPLNISIQAGANQLVVLSFPFTQATPASTWTIPHNFSDPNAYVQVFSTTHQIIYPDTVNTSDPNNAVLTFVTPTAGFAIAMHAGSINIATNQPNAIISNPTGSQEIGSGQSFTFDGPVTFIQPATLSALWNFNAGLTSSGPNTFNGGGTTSGAWTHSGLHSFNGGLTSTGPNSLSGGGSMAGTFTGNPLFSGNPIFSGAALVKNLNAIRYADQFPGATADVQINAAIADLPAGGGTVDARGYGATTQTIAATVTLGSNGPGGKPVNFLIDRATQFSCTITNSTPCWLRAGGSSIVGSGVVGTGGFFAASGSTITDVLLTQDSFANNVVGGLVDGVSVYGQGGATVLDAICGVTQFLQVTHFRNMTCASLGAQNTVALKVYCTPAASGCGNAEFDNIQVDCQGNTGCHPLVIGCFNSASLSNVSCPNQMDAVSFYGPSTIAHPGTGGLAIVQIEAQNGAGGSNPIGNINFNGTQIESKNAADIGFLLNGVASVTLQNIHGTAVTASGTDLVKLAQPAGTLLDGINLINITNQGTWTNTINNAVLTDVIPFLTCANGCNYRYVKSGANALSSNVWADGARRELTVDTNGVAPMPTTFASLGTPPNGVFKYCSDCTIANPCAGSGTGAIAKRLNGVWVCN